MTSDPALEPLERLVGTWTTEATHTAMPGVVVHGTVSVEWLEGERFLIHRARTDHPDFPDSISIIGFTGRDRADAASGAATTADGNARLTMNYYDSRGVFRVYEVEVDADTWRLSREAAGFSGTFSDDGNTILGRWQLRRDDIHWKDDLLITYRRE